MSGRPEKFLFGVATADHQCEAYDPAYPPDVWDTWERAGRVPQPREKATDFWCRYETDLDLAKGLGCNAFRFSISWTRVEPKPGCFDAQALDHYAKLAEAIWSKGMAPVITLCHFVWPQHLQDAGGLRSKEFPDRFAKYVGQVRRAIDVPVNYWLTFNEPDNLVLNHSQLSQRMAPGAPAGWNLREQIEGTRPLIRNLFEAHRLARAILQSGPHGASAGVSMNSEIRGIPIQLRATTNFLLPHLMRIPRPVRAVIPSWLYRLAWSFLLLSEGDWWELGSLGYLPDSLCPRACVNQLDFLAFDFYYGVKWLWQVPRLTSGLSGQFEREPVYPPNLYETLRYFDRAFKQRFGQGKPIVIMENGLVDQIKAYKALGETPPRWAMDPATCIRRHVEQVDRARAAGVDVRGYLVWSITSNREWGLKFSPSTDFGLFPINLDHDSTLTRGEATEGAKEYQRIIAEHASESS